MPTNRSPIRSISVVSGCRAPRGRRSQGSVTSTALLDQHPLRPARPPARPAGRRTRPAIARAGLVDPLAGVGLGGRRQRADLAAGQRDRRRSPRCAGRSAASASEVGGAGERLLGGGDGVVEGVRVEQRRPASGRTDRCGSVMAYGHSLTAAPALTGGEASLRTRGCAAARRWELCRRAGQARRPPTPAGWLNERRGAFIDGRLPCGQTRAGSRRAGSGRSVQADRGGRSQVQALGAAVDRHPDPGVGAAASSVGQAVRLRAEQPGGRRGQPPVVGRSSRSTSP